MSNLGRIIPFPEQRRDDTEAEIEASITPEVWAGVVELRKVTQPLRPSASEAGRMMVEREQQQVVYEAPQPVSSDPATQEAYRVAQIRQRLANMKYNDVQVEDIAA